MHKRTGTAVCLLLALLLSGCAVTAEELTGEAEGYGGPLRVMITMDGERLTGVTVTEHSETQGVGTRAIDRMPADMAREGTWDVDGVSGATVTSSALKAAVRDAMGVSEPVTEAPAQPAADTLRSGMGMSATGRIGPGKTEDGRQVYSVNVVFAHGLFDSEGRVVRLAVDQLEVLSEAEDASVTQLSGFPGGDISEEDFLGQVSAWRTKRGQGEDYRLPAGTWASQMDAYERLFQGMTVEEIEAWFQRYCSAETGRPLQPEEANEADARQFAALDEGERARLAEVTSGATISLRDEHGDVLTAIRRAWENAR